MHNNKGLDFSKPLILGGKQDSHPRFACVVSRELYLHPQPLEGGGIGVAWSKYRRRQYKTKKTAVSCLLRFVSGKRDSNSRPQPWQGCALPTELFPHSLNFAIKISPNCVCKGIAKNYISKTFCIFFAFFLCLLAVEIL